MIGNGFDLAHDLPTKYIHFMNFLEWCYFTENGDRVAADILLDNFNKKLKKYIEDNVNNEAIILPHTKRMVMNIKGNKWYEFFFRVMKEGMRIGDNWVDFESLIAIVINELENEPDEKFPAEIDDSMRKDILYKWVFHGCAEHDYRIVRPLIQELRKELDDFIQCLDEYITIVEKLPVKDLEKIKCIKNINFDYVISFNYSNIFEKHYEKPKHPVIYIHGKAGGQEQESISNLVVGCEETLPKEKCDIDIRCGYFKKYLQREIKNTARGYRVCESLRNRENSFLYIIGHSLDVNDGDIIKYLIENHEHITVFYYDIDDCISKTQNLVKILTKEGYEKQKWKINYKQLN